MLRKFRSIPFLCLLSLTLTISGCAAPVRQSADLKAPAVQDSVEQEQTFPAAVESKAKPKPLSPEKPENATGISGDLPAERPLLCVEAGHQGSGNPDKEPIAPGSSVMKAKVSSGTRGTATGKPEYELNLEVALKLKKVLQEDYEVIMVRETNKVDMSNKERAGFCSSSGADLMVRLHADGSGNPAIHGLSLLYPSGDSPYTHDISDESLTAARFLESAIVKETGVKPNGLVPRDDLTGFNWLSIPSVLVEMGFMSNHDEDLKLSQDDYQQKIATGIKKGLDAYYAAKTLPPGS
ncbi:N-acetylmuramoyl-L-alanine amidase family protein [Saccharibacillus deserti]|uniref:N-acetylmuramoyl-L-alanine amidase family protein n=1 Tax=Saccharibacillus deserti TaxID=1634444 RepID=UPI00155336DB|nr:N-acetylmuramoyl-L-alanine amidase [Saccharibacillus deserti]